MYNIIYWVYNKKTNGLRRCKLINIATSKYNVVGWAVLSYKILFNFAASYTKKMVFGFASIMMQNGLIQSSFNYY